MSKLIANGEEAGGDGHKRKKSRRLLTAGFPAAAVGTQL